GNILRRKACPLVADLNNYTAVLLRDQEVDGSADRTVFDGVAHEVVDGLADTVGVAYGRMIGGRGNPNGLFLARGERRVRLRHFLDQDRDVDGFAADGDIEGIRHRIRHEIVDHFGKPVGGVADIAGVTLHVL